LSLLAVSFRDFRDARHNFGIPGVQLDGTGGGMTPFHELPDFRQG
jgi:hypothetical protein